jgi:hypothetical protein
MYYKIYALKNPSFAKPYIKIGLTKNVERRIKDLNVATPTPFELVFSFDTGSISLSLATALEKYLHTTFSDKRCDAGRELFLVDPTYVLFQLISKLNDFHGSDFSTTEIVEMINSESSLNLIWNEVCDMRDDSLHKASRVVSSLEKKYMEDFHRPFRNNKMCFGEHVLKVCTGRCSLRGITPPIQLTYNKKASHITNAFTNLS